VSHKTAQNQLYKKTLLL